MEVEDPTKLPSSGDSRAPMSDHYNLLLYYDRSPESASALLRVIRLGAALTATVHVLSVAEIDLGIGDSVGCISAMARLEIEGEARLALEEALEHLGERGIVAHGHIATGNVVDSMARYAGLLHVYLLVLGYRSPRGLAKWLGRPSHHAALVKRAAGRAVAMVPLD